MIHDANSQPKVRVRNTETGEIVRYAFFIDTEKRILKTFARHATENRCLVDKDGLVKNTETYPEGKYAVEPLRELRQTIGVEEALEDDHNLHDGKEPTGFGD